ncbi:hypothetical protein C8A05DRAFT_33501 [Staphylotrichum tortipilum]|uniref:Uncharacterized protein n=1 Tax=Staphylotrichum tortipilum TaxID=2831512 RepID=A0AAN6RTF4_9PEZI|nr:hypothetical protein C8A05DRAFT_33501 [Staphylotrichum longicolle]
MNMVNEKITAEANPKAQQALDKLEAHALAGFAPRGIPANAAGNPVVSGIDLSGLIEPGLPVYDDKGADSGDRKHKCTCDEKPKCACDPANITKVMALKIAVVTGIAATFILCNPSTAHAAHSQVVRAEARAVDISNMAPIVARAVEGESSSSVTESVCTNSSSTTYPTPSAPIGAATINGAVASAKNMTTASMGSTTTGSDMLTMTEDMLTMTEDMATGNGMATTAKDTVFTVSTETTTVALSCAATPATATVTVTLTPTTNGGQSGDSSDTVVSETSTTTATTTVTAGSGSTFSTTGGSSTGASPTNLTTLTTTSTTTRYITVGGPTTANTTVTTLASADAIMGTGAAGTIGTILATGTGGAAINGGNSSMTYMIPTPSPTTSTFSGTAATSTIVSSDASGNLLKRAGATDATRHCEFLFGNAMATALGGARCAVLVAVVAWGFVMRG